MTANRRIGWMALATGAGILLLVVVFSATPDPIPRPEREPEDPIPVVGDVPRILADGPSATEVPAVTAAPGIRAKKPVDRRIPLEIAIIDGDTGEPLIEARPRLQVDAETSLILGPRGGLFVHPEATCKPRSNAHVRVTVGLPAGYGFAKPGEQSVHGLVSLYAERVRVTLPAWRHADVLVQVVDFEGYPVPGARVTSATFMGSGRKITSSPTDGNGWARVSGIPAVRGETLSVTAYTSIRHASASALVVNRWTTVRARIVLPKEPNNNLIGLGGGAGGSFGGRSGRRTLRMPGRESITVTVRHRDGRPAADTMVLARGSGNHRSGRTDANGRVVLNGLSPGAITVQVTEAGFVMGDGVPITVVAGTPASLTIVEAPPRWATGVVLDESGNPLPSARLVLTSGFRGKLPWLDKGLQHLNVLTGPDGRFEFPNVPPGGVVVAASYGTRSARAPVAKSGPTTVKLPAR